jgi:hypothetical protein
VRRAAPIIIGLLAVIFIGFVMFRSGMFMHGD